MDSYTNVTEIDGARVMDLAIHNIIGAAGTTSAYIKNQLKDQSIKTIMIDINSPGGSVFEGMAILNVLKTHPATIHGKVSGICASIASVILMGCDTIEMTKNSMLMVHMPTVETQGNADDLRKEADLLDHMKQNIIDAYKSKLKKPCDIEAMLKDETWLTPEQAKDLGLCDIISDTTPEYMDYFDFSKFRYKAVPEAVMNMYDVSSVVASVPEADSIQESDFNKFLNMVKKLFNFTKEKEMKRNKYFNQDLPEEATEEEILKKDEEFVPEGSADEEVLKKMEELMTENEALKAKIAELTKTGEEQTMATITSQYKSYLNSLVEKGSVRPADVDTHVDVLMSRHTDTAKSTAYKAMLEALPVAIDLNKHIADKANATDTDIDVIEVEATKLFKNYKADGKKVTLGDCYREAHKNSLKNS